MTVTVTGLKPKPNTEVFNLSLLLKSTEKKMSPKCNSSKQLKTVFEQPVTGWSHIK